MDVSVIIPSKTEALHFSPNGITVANRKMTNDLSHFVHFANSSNRYGVTLILLRFTLFRVNGWATFLEESIKSGEY